MSGIEFLGWMFAGYLGIGIGSLSIHSNAFAYIKETHLKNKTCMARRCLNFIAYTSIMVYSWPLAMALETIAKEEAE